MRILRDKRPKCVSCRISEFAGRQGRVGHRDASGHLTAVGYRDAAGMRPGNGLDVSAGAEANGAALVGAALVLAHSAPDPGVLAGVDRPAQALVDDDATTADLLGFFYLEQSRPAVANGKEQLWVYLTAGGLVTPVHDVNSLSPPVRPASACRLAFRNAPVRVVVPPPGLSRSAFPCPRQAAARRAPLPVRPQAVRSACEGFHELCHTSAVTSKFPRTFLMPS